MLGRKVIYVRCINCSYNNIAKGIRPLDKKAIFVYVGKISYKRELLKYYKKFNFVISFFFSSFFSCLYF